MGSQPENRELLAIAYRAAVAAAAVIRDAAPRVHSIDWRAKAPTDFVSEVDLEAEARIIEIVARELPEADILAEESASEAGSDAVGDAVGATGGAVGGRLTRGLVVVADPLDGTTNFLHGFPEYAVSIAVVRDGVPVAAVVANVPRDEWFTATLGGGATVAASDRAGAPSPGHGRPCRVSAITEPQRALIGTGFPFKEVADIPAYQAQMSRVMAGASGVRRPGAASLDLASVAAGRFDAFWETMLAPWDFAAGMLLVTEAGGLATTVGNGALSPLTPSSVLAGSPAMHAWLGRTLAPG